ncbi:hypothetical protein HJFPF1_02088 [Paramyrothecium foliicola]|nr:hypothetical protein HJFPF1_02088 [Paramyrothecium foliicola]
MFETLQQIVIAPAAMADAKCLGECTNDLESQSLDDDGGANTGAFYIFLDYMHPMGPSIPQMPLADTALLPRRVASIILSAMLLIFAGVPFSLLSWAIAESSKSLRLADSILSHTVLAISCYFHFRIASITQPVVYYLEPFRYRHRMGIRKGQLQKLKIPRTAWRPRVYWVFVTMELVYLALGLYVPEFRKVTLGFIMLYRWSYLVMDIEAPA